MTSQSHHFNTQMTLRNFIAAAAVALGVFAAEAAVNVVPRPVSVEEHDGQFTLTSKTSIGYAEGLEEYAMYLDSILLQSTGYELPVVAGTSKAAIALSIDSAAVGASEGYRLEVGRKRITVVARQGRPVLRIADIAAALPGADTFRPSGKKCGVERSMCEHLRRSRAPVARNDA